MKYTVINPMFGFNKGDKIIVMVSNNSVSVKKQDSIFHVITIMHPPIPDHPTKPHYSLYSQVQWWDIQRKKCIEDLKQIKLIK